MGEKAAEDGIHEIVYGFWSGVWRERDLGIGPGWLLLSLGVLWVLWCFLVYFSFLLYVFQLHPLHGGFPNMFLFSTAQPSRRQSIETRIITSAARIHASATCCTAMYTYRLCT